MRTTAYRVPGELAVLAMTLLVVGAVIVLTAAATVCGSAVFVALFVLMSYQFTRDHHRRLMASAQRVTPETQPELAELAQRGLRRLQPGAVDVFVVPQAAINAYTFGLDDPKGLVVFTPLVRLMDADELLFVLGHEMGHVALGHTWLNSMIGGLAGIPSSFSAAVILQMAFLSWNRMCEYSADRAGLLACANPEKAISALVKLAAGERSLARGGRITQADLDQAYRQIDAEDDTLSGNLNEALHTHPLLIRRINEIRKYAATSGYRRLVEGMDRAG